MTQYHVYMNLLTRSLYLCCLFQSEPEDHAGAGEAQSGAWETQIHRPGEEPQAAWADVRVHGHSGDSVWFSLMARYNECAAIYLHLHQYFSRGRAHVQHLLTVCIWTVVVVVQGDAGQKGAGQAGPEGSGGDSGKFISINWWLKALIVGLCRLRLCEFLWS